MFKKTIARATDFFLFSSFYIALCAVVMVWQTCELLMHSRPTIGITGFVFFATVCSYNFHWWLTPASETYSQRIYWAQQHKGWHLFLYFIGLAGSFVFFLFIRSHWPALAFAAFITFLYSAPKLPQPVFRGLKKIAIGKTIFLSFVWMYVTTVLPVIIAGAEWNSSFFLFALSRFFLIYAICILFDYRDREDDRKAGIKSMITTLGEKGIDRLFFISLVCFSIVTIALYRNDYSILTIAILLIPGVIVAAVYPYAKKNFSDYLYYFVLDGLMMFSGLLMLVYRF